MSDDTIKMAKEAGVSIRGHYDETGSTPQELERLIALARAAEREACAKVCDDWPNGRDDVYSIGVAIRARGNT